ncbi:MAG: hypothetical protein IT168_28845 [Bryobacterales bacterium]|nr:hypothetical protein [Bryobacterales bacterium]
MTEWLKADVPKTDITNYHLRHRVTVDGEKWEYWQGIREIVMLRYEAASETFDFHGELLGSERISKVFFQVEIPAQVEIGGRVLALNEVEALAAKMHLALCSMKERNVVAQIIPCPILTDLDRDRVLGEFEQWMDQRGYRVKIDRTAEKILIKRKGLGLFRCEQTRTAICDRGRWIARAFHALLGLELDRTVLFVSQGARPTSNWLAGIDW